MKMKHYSDRNFEEEEKILEELADKFDSLKLKADSVTNIAFNMLIMASDSAQLNPYYFQKLLNILYETYIEHYTKTEIDKINNHGLKDK